MQMRGTVRFRFRSPENNIDVIIEGESNVVESLRQELGLQGRVGFIQPLSARLVDDSELESHAAMGDGENLSNVLTEEEKLLAEYNDYMNRINTWKKNHGIFYKDIQKLEDAVAIIMDKRSDKLIDYRRTRKQRYLDEANDILKDALKTIKTFSKVELLASLSKR